MTQYAKMQTKACPMHDPACAEKIIEHIANFYPPGFDAVALVEKHCGRYTRGKHVGALRGWAHVTVCVEGGWLRGRVAYPGTVIGITISDFNGTVYLEV
jgi:hypothetical protein